MDFLPHSFTIFTASGLWRPLTWSSGLKRHLYNCYTFIILVVIYLFGFMEFVEAMHNFGNIEEMVSASFMLLTTGNVFCKAVNVVNRREDIINIFQMLNDNVCQSQSQEEDRIQAKINNRIRNNATWYFCIVQCAVVMITISSVIQNIPNRTLPFKAWIPLNYSSNNVYWYIYYYQVIAHAAVAIISIAYDTMVPGIMLLTGAQLKIFKFRCENMSAKVEREQRKFNLSKVALENKILKESVCHHETIVQFAMSFNDIFSTVIFVQYTVSSLVICVSVYRLAGMALNDSEFPFALFYLLCMINQIFCFCWYGNEVIIELFTRWIGHRYT
ncbi:odorant receptor Or1-like isoform X2 [Diachasmimorpha longicaudata]|uniref:odorant receptor Or1-like isoform X2 n=1 Tax=Diachasmimorpha longicaudata TaxID=58733 RepID=UPI0030B904C7